MKVYLAGPEVFYAGAAALGAEKKRLCADAGVEGLFPLDAAPPDGLEPAATAAWIYRANVGLIDACDAVLANISPYKSVDCDPGTAWEIGYAAARGKRVCAYSNDPRSCAEKDAAIAAALAGGPLDGHAFFPFGRTQPEGFGQVSNLMIACAVEATGGFLEIGGAAEADDLGVFRRALARLAAAG